MKIAFIGGGALRTLGAIREWCSLSHSSSSDNVIMDLDLSRAELVAGLANLMPEARKGGRRFRATDNLAEALDAADFVYIVIRVGGVTALEEDKMTGIRYGYHGHDDFGPSGMALAVRTIPVILNIAGKMEKLCPEAWLLIFANPEAVLLNAVTRYTGIKCAGFCPGPGKGLDQRRGGGAPWGKAAGIPQKQPKNRRGPVCEGDAPLQRLNSRQSAGGPLKRWWNLPRSHMAGVVTKTQPCAMLAGSLD